MTKKPTNGFFWNRNCISSCLANLLLSVGVFMQFPLCRGWAGETGEDVSITYACAALFGLGMLIPGPFSARLVDVFSTKRLAMFSAVVLLLGSWVLFMTGNLVEFTIVRLVQGMAFGIFQMAVGCTMINDISVSDYRTRIDYYYMGIYKWSVPLGVALALCLSLQLGWMEVRWVAPSLMGASLVVIGMTSIPFKAPTGVPWISLDRFLYPHAWILIFNVLPVAVVMGVFVANTMSAVLILWMAAGMLAALLTHRGFFSDADDRADIVAGMLLMLGAVVALSFQTEVKVLYFLYVMFGVGMGWAESRFILYFLKLSGHCQRGTLQQTYILTVTIGICWGIWLATVGWSLLLMALVLLVGALAMVLLFTHRWFTKHGDREFKFREV